MNREELRDRIVDWLDRNADSRITLAYIAYLAICEMTLHFALDVAFGLGIGLRMVIALPAIVALAVAWGVFWGKPNP